MSRGDRRKAAQAKVEALKIQGRNGILVAVASLVIMAVIIALKLSFESAGVEWLSHPAANMTIFMLAIFAAGIAGWGTNRWSKSRDEIRRLQSKYK